jgi:hypothetical protein
MNVLEIYAEKAAPARATPAKTTRDDGAFARNTVTAAKPVMKINPRIMAA